MTDDRPEPKYGQYAPIPPAPPAPEPVVTEPVVTEPVVPKSGNGDALLTTLLLMIGTYDVVASFPGFASFGASLRAAYDQQGIDGFSSGALADSMGIAINTVRIVLLVLAIILSLIQIGRGRRGFWIPLAAGAAAAIVMVVCVFVVLLGDPALVRYVTELSGQ